MELHTTMFTKQIKYMKYLIMDSFGVNESD